MTAHIGRVEKFVGDMATATTYDGELIGSIELVLPIVNCGML